NKIFKISNGNFIGMNIRDIWQDYYKFYNCNRVVKEKEYAIFYKDLKEIIYDVNIDVIFDDKKSLIYKIFILKDITDKLNTEKAIKLSEEKFRSIFENSLDGIYLSTLDGKYIDANKSLVEMLGYYNREELISKDIRKDIYYSERDRPQY